MEVDDLNSPSALRLTVSTASAIGITAIVTGVFWFYFRFIYSTHVRHSALFVRCLIMGIGTALSTSLAEFILLFVEYRHLRALVMFGIPFLVLHLLRDVLLRIDESRKADMRSIQILITGSLIGYLCVRYGIIFYFFFFVPELKESLSQIK